MAIIRNAAVLVASICFFGSAAVAGDGVDISVKAILQASMQQHIDRNLVDGAYLHVDRGTGDVRRLYPAAAHPIIMRLGEYFVLCSDFRDGRGQDVNIDFYLAPRGRTFVVFDTMVNDRRLLGRMIEAGKASRVD